MDIQTYVNAIADSLIIFSLPLVLFYFIYLLMKLTDRYKD